MEETGATFFCKLIITAAILRRATRRGASSTDFSTAMVTSLISSSVPYVTGTVNPPPTTNSETVPPTWRALPYVKNVPDTFDPPLFS